MTASDYCPSTDGRLSYDVAIAAIRERLVREGKVLPLPNNPTEARWAREGAAAARTEQGGETRP